VLLEKAESAGPKTKKQKGVAKNKIKKDKIL